VQVYPSHDRMRRGPQADTRGPDQILFLLEFYLRHSSSPLSDGQSVHVLATKPVDFHLDNAVSLEKSMLGCVMEKPELLDEVDPNVVDDLLLSDHRLLLRAMVKLHADGIVPDVLLLADESGVDLAYIADLRFSGCLLGNFHRYVADVRKAAQDRRFRQYAEELTKAGADDRPRILQRMQEVMMAPSGVKVIRKFAEVQDLLNIPVKSDVCICRDLLEPGAVTLLVSSPGVGKSFLGMSLAVNVALGGTFLGRECAATRVLMLDRENPLRLLQKRLRLLAGGPVPNLKVWCGASTDPPPMIGDQRILAMAREERTLFVFDTLTRFHNANENSATGNGDGDAGMSYVTGQARLLADQGSTVLILHHRGKSAARYRGSEEILANVDVAFELERDGKNGRKLHNFKNRDGKDDFDIGIRCDFERGVFTCTDTTGVAERKDSVQVLQAFIQQNPGASTNKIIGASGLRASQASELLRQHEGLLWRCENGPRRARLYFPCVVPGPKPPP
jgi:hypothetical protein